MKRGRQNGFDQDVLIRLICKCRPILNLSLAVCGGRITSAPTERKLGMNPSIRLVCSVFEESDDDKLVLATTELSLRASGNC
jgi:hypothetical protein